MKYSTSASNHRHSIKKKTTLWIITIGLTLLLFEVLSSLVLLYNYRFKQTDLTNFQGEVSYLSSINLIFKAGKEAGIFKARRKAGIFKQDEFLKAEYRKETQPDPFLIPDSILGYRALPGEYTHTYFRRLKFQHDWEALKIKVTINEDGTRWTGNAEQIDGSTVYIFGDSFIFGSGVNDEHTFAYLLQQGRPDLKVKLFALGGYSLTQAYLIFNTLKNSIKSDDIIILGYAKFYDERHVAAPSRVRKNYKRALNYDPALLNRIIYIPKASLVGEDKLSFEYIQTNCLNNNSYCDEPDPSSLEMTQVTAAIINYIADNTAANVYLLHFEGDTEDSLFKLIRSSIKHVSALSNDFDYFIRDDIEGFDAHPGPYWHYAISRKLVEVISN